LPEEATMNRNTMNTMVGTAAIDYAELHGLKVSKHADPVEGARSDVTVEEAREIAASDPSLIFMAEVIPPEYREYLQTLSSAGLAGTHRAYVRLLRQAWEFRGTANGRADVECAVRRLRQITLFRGSL
jgi:hypothetical protein